jgi:hypothetical protein
MENSEIEKLINKIWENCISHKIEINSINKQIEKIEIIFSNDFLPFEKLGLFIDEIENLIMEDLYGDLIGLDFKYTNQYEKEGDDDNLYIQFLFTFHIDS